MNVVSPTYKIMSAVNSFLLLKCSYAIMIVGLLDVSGCYVLNSWLHCIYDGGQTYGFVIKDFRW